MSKEFEVFVKWSKDLEIGVPFVDVDHKVLINLINQVHNCIDEHEETTVLGSVLDALAEYTDYHFTREENLMELSGYADLENHRKYHRKLYHQVRALYHQFEADPASVAAVEVKEFLSTWLVQHIQGCDFDYRAACVGHSGINAAAGSVSFFKGDTAGHLPFPEWSTLRVMLVDDNANFRMLVKTILKAVGIRNLDIMDNARDGLARLSQRPADIVLCDWVMDDMNGAEFSRQVAEMDLPTRVVLLTGYSVDVLKERSTDSTVFSYLEKPIRAQELLATITRSVTTANLTH